MIGTYVKHPVYGVGKVIKISSISELVFSSRKIKNCTMVQ